MHFQNKTGTKDIRQCVTKDLYFAVQISVISSFNYQRSFLTMKRPQCTPSKNTLLFPSSFCSSNRVRSPHTIAAAADSIQYLTPIPCSCLLSHTRHWILVQGGWWPNITVQPFLWQLALSVANSQSNFFKLLDRRIAKFIYGDRISEGVW